LHVTLPFLAVKRPALAKLTRRVGGLENHTSSPSDTSELPASVETPP
jgi:hypothetical protein